MTDFRKVSAQETLGNSADPQAKTCLRLEEEDKEEVEGGGVAATVTFCKLRTAISPYRWAEGFS